jgi:hypothetical protein
MRWQRSEYGQRRWRLRGRGFLERFVVARRFERFIVRRLRRVILRQRVERVVVRSPVRWRFAGVRSTHHVALQRIRRGPRRRRTWRGQRHGGRRWQQRRRSMLGHVQRDLRWHQFRRQLRMPSRDLRLLRAHDHRRRLLRLPRLPGAQFGVQRVRALRFSALRAVRDLWSLAFRQRVGLLARNAHEAAQQAACHAAAGALRLSWAKN